MQARASMPLRSLASLHIAGGPASLFGNKSLRTTPSLPRLQQQQHQQQHLRLLPLLSRQLSTFAESRLERSRRAVEDAEVFVKAVRLVRADAVPKQPDEALMLAVSEVENNVRGLEQKERWEKLEVELARAVARVQQAEARMEEETQEAHRMRVDDIQARLDALESKMDVLINKAKGKEESEKAHKENDEVLWAMEEILRVLERVRENTKRTNKV